MHKQTFGATLKKIRKSKNISQKALSEGLCSQPMLSSIENGKYIPNSNLLIGLCQKLGIQADTLVLQDHFKISSSFEYSKQAQNLCNQHKYQELKDFLESDDVLQSIDTSSEYQAYYYYLGCSEYHLDSTLTASESDFQLVLAENQSNGTPNTLSRLALGGLGLIYARKQQTALSKKFADLSLDQISNTLYEENLNILFYLKAYSEFLNGRFLSAATTIDEGISFITQHHSIYMLANLYFLLATVTDKSISEEELAEARHRSNIFEELYHEKIFKKI